MRRLNGCDAAGTAFGSWQCALGEWIMAGRWHPKLLELIDRSGGDAIVPLALHPLFDLLSEAFFEADERNKRAGEAVAAAEGAREKAERQLHTLLSLLPDMYLRVRRDGVILDGNPGELCKECEPSKMVGRRLSDLPGACGGAVLPSFFERVCAHTGRRVEELEFLNGTSVRYVEVAGVPLEKDECLIFVRDISARRSVEEQLRRLAAAVEQAADAVVVTDVHGVILYVNPAFEHIFGYTRAEVEGKTPAMLKSGRHDAAFYSQLWSAITAGNVWRGQLTDRRKDGSLVELRTTISPVRNERGAVLNFVAVSHDVTRETEMREQLRRAQRMESLARLAGGIAHDFNNLLTSILGNAELAIRRAGPAPAVRELLEQIRETAERAAAFIQQLLAFSRRQASHPQIVSLNEAVEKNARMIRRLAGSSIEVELLLDPAIGPIRIDPVQLEQVLMNLSINARDAMPSGGRLRYRTFQACLERTDFLNPPDLEPGLYVGLEISDTGVGMDAETQAHLFEPFFTTKEVGKGTGLGLSSVYGIVTHHGGGIAVRSVPGTGTTFMIYFPQARAAMKTLHGISPAESK